MATRSGPSFGNGAFTSTFTVDDLTGAILWISYVCKNGTATITMKPKLAPIEVTPVDKGDPTAKSVIVPIANPVNIALGGSYEISWSAAY